MALTSIQSSFQFGEVSRLLHARVDSPIYYHSVKRLRNMIVTPQGGAEKRFGTTYVGTINNHAATPVYETDYTKVKPFIFDYQDDARYLLIFRAGAIDVYSEDGYQTSVLTNYTADEIQHLNITQSASIVYIAIGTHPPRSLTRSGTGPIAISTTTPVFAESPTFDFKQTYDNFTFSITVSGTPITTSQNLLGQTVTITCSNVLFDANYTGGLFQGEGGTIRITAYTSATVVQGRITQIFATESSLFHSGATPAGTMSGQDCVVSEVAFSDTRGWPQTVAFFQNRLFFGRTSTLLGAIWGSDYNGYSYDKLHFDDSQADATNAISTIVQGNKSTLIQHILGFKTLLVFTTSGVYSTPLLSDTPIVPENIEFLNLQTADASSSVTPVIFDNDVIFFDKGGRKVKNINVFATTQHYETRNISVLSPHLVDVPYSAAVFENSTVKDGNWLFMTNSGSNINGALSVYQSVPEQEITAWSLTTAADTVGGEGKFRHVVCDEETAYFIVERIVGGNTRLFIEKLSFDTYMDAVTLDADSITPIDTITGLDYLNGETVGVVGDNAPMQDRVVENGEITLEYEVTSYQVGLKWEPEIVPLPVNFTLPGGNNLYQPKNIKSVYVDFYESTGIRVNGDLIPPYRIDDDVYNSPPNLQTGAIQVQPMGGWDPNQEISITQTVPMAMQILGICFVVET